MNFTFTWILDKFGFQPKVETFDFPFTPKKVGKKATKAAKEQAAKDVKASALAKLAALGLTQDEVKALVG